MAHRQWQGSTDGGEKRQGQLSKILRHIDIRVIYCVLPFVVCYYLIFKYKRAHAIYSCLRRRQGFSWLRAVVGTYRNHLIFGKCFLDKFYVFSGHRDKFRVAPQDRRLFDHYAQMPQPLIIVSAHVGNFEISAYMGGKTGKQLRAIVYAGDTEQMNRFRSAAMEENNMAMLGVKEDMSHIFEISQVLDNKGILTLTGDRSFTARRVHTYNFLGAPAEFPIAIYYFAERYKANVISMFVIREKTFSYKIFSDVLTIPAEIKGRDARAIAYGQAYVNRLEEIVRRYPLQWFNFYDFWEAPTPDPKSVEGGDNEP